MKLNIIKEGQSEVVKGQRWSNHVSKSLDSSSFFIMIHIFKNSMGGQISYNFIKVKSTLDSPLENKI